MKNMTETCDKYPTEKWNFSIKSYLNRSKIKSKLKMFDIFEKWKQINNIFVLNIDIFWRGLAVVKNRLNNERKILNCLYNELLI
jgi:hypothetical protein